MSHVCHSATGGVLFQPVTHRSPEVHELLTRRIAYQQDHVTDRQATEWNFGDVSLSCQ